MCRNGLMALHLNALLAQPVCSVSKCRNHKCSRKLLSLANYADLLNK
jgi:hypothetical protein